MYYLIIILGVIGVLYIYFKIKGSIIKHAASMNALVAKATYQQLNNDMQNEVIDRNLFIMQRDGGFPLNRERIDKMKDKEKYGFYALAMLELEIKPLSRKWKW